MKHSYGVLAVMLVLGVITSVNGCVTNEGHRGSIIDNNPLFAYYEDGSIDLEQSLRKIEATIELVINIDLGAGATELEIQEAHAEADEKLYLLRLAIDYLGKMKALDSDPEFLSLASAVENAVPTIVSSPVETSPD